MNSKSYVYLHSRHGQERDADSAKKKKTLPFLYYFNLLCCVNDEDILLQTELISIA